jgi:putative FmdB family regulatory protein
MPAYAYRCRSCDASFEVTRSITADVSGAVPCPAGHVQTSRVFTPVAVGGGASTASVPAAPAGPPARGCCGGGCCG